MISIPLLLISTALLISRLAYTLSAQFFKPGTDYSLWGSTSELHVPWLLAIIPLSSFPVVILGYLMARYYRNRKNEKIILEKENGVSELESNNNRKKRKKLNKDKDTTLTETRKNDNSTGAHTNNTHRHAYKVVATYCSENSQLIRYIKKVIDALSKFSVFCFLPRDLSSISLKAKVYFLLVVLEALNQIGTAFSLYSLNVTVYSLVKGSSIIFMVALYWTFTEKNFNFFHYLGVLAIFLSFIFIAVSGLTVIDEVDASPDFVLGLIAGILAAICNSLISFTSYVYLKKINRKKDMFQVIEMTMVQITGAFFIVFPIGMALEFDTWKVLPSIAMTNDSLPLFISLVFVLYISFPCVIFGNSAVTSFSSGVFLKILGILRRVIAILLGILIFKDFIDEYDIVSIILGTSGAFIYIYGGWKETQRKQEIKIVKKLPVEKKAFQNQLALQVYYA